jgi:hypothetical protein
MSDIFISYASSDRPVAQEFARALEASGWSVWWDREIPVGKSFDQVIEEELNAARCVVVLWSKESVASRWVKTESAAAADRDRLVPALIGDVAIPLEFKRIQTAMLQGWAGDTAQPEFHRLVEAVGEMVGRSEPGGRAVPRDTEPRREALGQSKISPQWLGRGAAGVLLILIILIVVRSMFRGPAPAATPPASSAAPQSTVAPPSANSTTSASSPKTSTDSPKVAPPNGAFSIKIGDKIDDGVPVPGAGNIAAPYAQQSYVFTASPGQNVYFRHVRQTPGIAYLLWKLLDDRGTEVFKVCLGCGEPGVQTLIKGGTYTLMVGSDSDPSTGTYQLQLFNVPPPGRFSIKIGDVIKDSTPGPGAGIIESPGAEDIYTFTAMPRQGVYFRVAEGITGMAYVNWRLVDDNGMVIFNSCLGCSDPGVQTLINGGTYTLTVGNRTDPSTGSYRLQLFNVPPPGQFSLKIGDKVAPGTPGAGAGVIESPGAEDMYVFSAAPGQKVLVHLLEHSTGTNDIKWRLVDDNGAEVFNTCLGCSDPGVQTLVKGGQYTLTVGNRTNPSTGNYAFEIGAR